MDRSGAVSERVLAIERELLAMGGLQNLAVNGVPTVSATATYTGTDNSSAMDYSTITFKIRLIFETTESIDFTPFAVLAYQGVGVYVHHNNQTSEARFWFPARVESSGNGRVAWIVENCANPDYAWITAGTQERIITVQAQVYSLVSGSLRIERLI